MAILAKLSHHNCKRGSTVAQLSTLYESSDHIEILLFSLKYPSYHSMCMLQVYIQLLLLDLLYLKVALLIWHSMVLMCVCKWDGGRKKIYFYIYLRNTG